MGCLKINLSSFIKEEKHEITWYIHTCNSVSSSSTGSLHLFLMGTAAVVVASSASICITVTVLNTFIQVFLKKNKTSKIMHWKNKNEIKTRIAEQRSTIRCKNMNYPVSAHFDEWNHPVSSLRYIGIEQDSLGSHWPEILKSTRS